MRIKRTLALLCALALLLSALPPAPAQAETAMVRVRLSVGDIEKLSMSASGAFRIAEANAAFTGGTLTLTASGSTVTVKHSKLGTLYSGKKVTINRETMAVDGGAMTFRAGGYTRSYLGNFSVTASKGLLQVVNHVPLSHYLYGVVGYEMSNSWPLEALKAQAVAAKNYALSKMGAGGSYDMVDTASDQVYKGYVSTLKNVIAAVDATMHTALYLNGSVMPCWYSASNGGYMILPSRNWGSTLYDGGYEEKTDPFDTRNTASRSETAYLPADLARRSFSSAALYSFFMNKLDEAVAAEGALSAGFVFDSYAGLSSVISTDASGNPTADRNHRQIVVTVTVNTKLDPANATPAPTPSPTPMVTPTPEPTESPTPKPTETPEPTESPEPSPAPDPNASADPTPDPDVTPEAEASASPEPSDTPEPTETPEPTRTPKPTATPVPTPTPTPFAPVTQRQENVVLTIPFQEMYDAGLFTDSALRIYYAYPSEGGYTLYHGRFGHGVGMSQRGAQLMANEGWTYEQILSFYYPGAEFRTLDYTAPEEQPGGGPGGGAETTPLPESETGAAVSAATTLYNGPGTDSGAVESLPYGARLFLTGLDGDWYQTRVAESGNVGYVRCNAVHVTGNTVIAEGVVSGSGVNVRTGPSTGYDSIAKLNRNTTVSILAYTNGWYRIRADNGAEGYMSGSYLIVSKKTAEEIGGTPAPQLTPTPGPDAGPTPTPEPGQTPTPVPMHTATPTPSPSPTPDNRFTAYGSINATNVNFRTGPSTSTASLGRYSRGTEFGVYGKSGSWYHVRLLSTGQDGYVYARYLTLTGSGTGDTQIIGAGSLTTGGVNIRTGPSTAYKSLGKLQRNTLVTVLGTEGSWYRVRVASSGQEGYVFARYISLNHTGAASGGTASSGQAKINAGLLNLRDQPSTSKGKVLLTMRRGYTVTVHSIANGWAYVTYNGKKGYCYAKYLTLQ